ncbi:TlpA family protein disulfide reductase [Ekhidna sp.]|uniref:TlpA family protein disulfide reductase n=1 Tax=Ekhidna sp. TaxID=2608089 RepID=UPI003B5068D7
MYLNIILRVCVFLCISFLQFNSTAQLSEGSMAPSFTLEDLSGKSYNLSDFKGKYVLIDFWASWCGPCKVYSPEIQRLHERYGPLGLEVIGVNIEGKNIKARSFIEDNDMKFLFLFDKGDFESPTARKYQIQGIPNAVLIDKEQRILFQGHPLDIPEETIAELFNVTLTNEHTQEAYDFWIRKGTSLDDN